MMLSVVSWVLELGALNLSKKISFESGDEGQLPRQESKEDDTTGPDVRSLSVIRLFLCQGGVHVVWGSAIS